MLCLQASATDFNTSIKEYEATTDALLNSLVFLRDNAAACGGFVANGIAHSMPKSIADVEKQREKVRALKGTATDQKSLIALVAEAQSGNALMESYADFIAKQLNVPNPNCQTVLVAFREMRAKSLLIPEQLQAILSGIQLAAGR